MQVADTEFKLFLDNVRVVNTLIDTAIRKYSSLHTIKQKIARSTNIEEVVRSDADAQSVAQIFQGILKSIESQIAMLSQHSCDTPTKKYYYQIHIKALSERAYKVLDAFRQQESAIISAEQQRLKEQYLAVKPSASAEELELLNDLTQSHALFKLAYSFKDKDSLAAIQNAEARHLSVISMLQDLRTLSKVSEHLQSTIQEATSQINSISYTTHAMHQDTHRAHKSLLSGIYHRKRLRTLKLISTGLLCFVILAVCIPFLKLIVWRR